jgi:hypothetical protein
MPARPAPTTAIAPRDTWSGLTLSSPLNTAGGRLSNRPSSSGTPLHERHERNRS